MHRGDEGENKRLIGNRMRSCRVKQSLGKRGVALLRWLGLTAGGPCCNIEGASDLLCAPPSPCSAITCRSRKSRASGELLENDDTSTCTHTVVAAITATTQKAPGKTCAEASVGGLEVGKEEVLSVRTWTRTHSATARRLRDCLPRRQTVTQTDTDCLSFCHGRAAPGKARGGRTEGSKNLI